MTQKADSPSDPIQTVRKALEHVPYTANMVERIGAAVPALDRIEAVVKAAREYRSTNPTVKGAAALDAALAALDPTEAPHG